MKRLFTGILVMLSAWLLMPYDNNAHALRCDGKIIDSGTSKAEILHRCGEPTWVEDRREKRIIRGCRPAYDPEDNDWDRWDQYRRRYRGYGRYYDACVIYVDIEEWFYNFGPGRLTQTLLFEDNRLVDVRDGSYGY